MFKQKNAPLMRGFLFFSTARFRQGGRSRLPTPVEWTRTYDACLARRDSRRKAPRRVCHGRRDSQRFERQV